MNNLVSIIIPCYNQGIFLAQTLESVLNQVHKDWECIIVNDGSTDNSAEIANIWCEKDNRFKLINKPNGGLSSARNAGLDHAAGNWIQFLDSDDILSEKKISDSLNYNTDIVLTNFSLFRHTTAETNPNYCDLNIVDFNFFTR